MSWTYFVAIFIYFSLALTSGVKRDFLPNSTLLDTNHILNCSQFVYNNFLSCYCFPARNIYLVYALPKLTAFISILWNHTLFFTFYIQCGKIYFNNYWFPLPSFSLCFYISQPWENCHLNLSRIHAFLWLVSLHLAYTFVLNSLIHDFLSYFSLLFKIL